MLNSVNNSSISCNNFTKVVSMFGPSLFRINIYPKIFILVVCGEQRGRKYYIRLECMIGVGGMVKCSCNKLGGT